VLLAGKLFPISFMQSHHENDEISSCSAIYMCFPCYFRTLSDLLAKWRGHQLKGLVKARDIEIALLDEK
jgi:hypothetical protein